MAARCSRNYHTLPCSSFPVKNVLIQLLRNLRAFGACTLMASRCTSDCHTLRGSMDSVTSSGALGPCSSGWPTAAGSAGGELSGRDTSVSADSSSDSTVPFSGMASSSDTSMTSGWSARTGKGSAQNRTGTCRCSLCSCWCQLPASTQLLCPCPCGEAGTPGASSAAWQMAGLACQG